MIDASAVLKDFARVETWVFDLDNTLYPHHLNLWHQVDERIRDYIAGYLKVAHEDAFRIQKDYYKRYGTSMRGLMAEHGMSPDEFLDYVHQIDHSPLEPNPALGAPLERLAAPPASSSSPRAPASMPRRSCGGWRSMGISRTSSTSWRPSSSPSRWRRPTTAFWRVTASTRARPPCSRTWRAISRCPMRSA